MCNHHKINATLPEVITVGEFGRSESSKAYKQDFSFDGIIRKISIKSRTWRENTVIQGIQVHLDNGFTCAYGMSYNDITNVTTLEVPQGLRIKNVQVRSDIFINSLAFILNNGQILGPVGGKGGRLQHDNFSFVNHNHYYLSGISGSAVKSYKAMCLCKLKFRFTLES